MESYFKINAMDGFRCANWSLRGNYVSEEIFKYGMALIILFSVGQMYYWENRKKKNSDSLEFWE